MRQWSLVTIWSIHFHNLCSLKGGEEKQSLVKCALFPQSLLYVDYLLLNSTYYKVPIISKAFQASITFSMLVCELKGLDQTHRLLNRASDWEVVDSDLSQYSLVINDEKTPSNRKKDHKLKTEKFTSTKERCQKLKKQLGVALNYTSGIWIIFHCYSHLPT